MKPSFVSPIIEKIAQKLGIEIHLEPRYGYAGQLVLPSGHTRYFRGTMFDLNSLGASEIAEDKAYATYFLRRLGYPVPEEEVFFTDRWCEVIKSKRNWQAAYRYAKKLGWPVIVKPNSKSQGSGVTEVYNQRELQQAVRSFEGRERVFLVQRLVVGFDYRIVVLDREIISIYERQSLSVIGDGRSTINGLLRKKQAKFVAESRDTIIPIDDFRITNRLKRLGLSRDSRLELGRRITLLPNANLSTGGDAIDVTDNTHSVWRKLAVKIAKDMNLRYVGIDVISKTSLTDTPDDYVVLEINAAPGLDNYASLGKKQMTRVEAMYEKVVKAMIH